MKYEEFVANVKECIKSMQGKEVRIHVSRIVQNNGGARDSISILSDGENVTPAISLEPFYRMVCQGSTVEEAAVQIIQYLNKFRQEKEMDTGFFTDYSRAKSRIACRLIHSEKNEELLSHIPHMRFLDLAVVYYYLLEENVLHGGTILLQDVHLKMWNVSLGEIHERAMQNTPKLLPCEFLTMRDMIKELIGISLPDMEETIYPMYVLTNKTRNYGAVYMLYGDILEKIYGVLGEDFYVLPGSVHECILVPASIEMSERELQQMVQEINETQVAPEELLSDSVYRYCHSGKCLCIAS